MKFFFIRVPVFFILFSLISTATFAQRFDVKYELSEGFALFKLGDKYGYFDENDKAVIACEYENANSFSEGLAGVCKNGKWGFINRSASLVIPYQYEQAGSFTEGLALVKQNGKFGFINKLGRQAIPFKYEKGSYFSNGIAAVKYNGYWGCIDNTGATVIGFKYDQCGDYQDGLIRVLTTNWDMGYVDINEKTVIPFVYNSGFDFQEGLTFVTKDKGSEKNWGVIDKTGKQLTPFKYSYAHGFEKGYALVERDKKWGVIDKMGRELVSPAYDYSYASDKMKDMQNGRTVATTSSNATNTTTRSPETIEASAPKSIVKTMKTWATISRLIKKPVIAMKSQLQLENYSFTRKESRGNTTSYYYKDASDKYFIQGQGEVCDTYTMVEYGGNAEAVSFSLMGRKDAGLLALMGLDDDFKKEIKAAGFKETNSKESDYGNTTYYRNNSLGLNIKLSTTSVMGFVRYVDVYVYGENVRLD